MENQNNEDLALYVIKYQYNDNPTKDYYSINFDEDSMEDKFIYLYNKLELDINPNMERLKITDLTEIKSMLENQKEAIDKDYYTDEEIANFTKKVDKKLIEHICEKYYSGYENCEADQKFFKENKIDYDENGFIKGVQAIGDNGWLDILTEKNIDGLDTLFKNEYFAKKHNLYELCDLLDDGLGTCERRAGFLSKDEIKDFIAKEEIGETSRAYDYKIIDKDGKDVTEALKNEVRNELLNQQEKTQEPTEKENEVKAFAVVMKDLSENNQDKIMIPIAFETKEEAEAFIIKHRQENPNENANYDIEKINDFKQIKEFSSQNEKNIKQNSKFSENRFENLVIPDDLRNNKAGKEQDLER